MPVNRWNALGISRRRATPSLCFSASTCALAVLGEIPSRSPISSSVKPSARSERTCLASFVFLLGLLELGTLRRVADALERAEIALRTRDLPAGGLEPGAPVPPFSGELSGGESITNEQLAGSPYAVVFVSSNCSACETLLRELPSAVSLPAPVLVVVNDFTDAPDLDEAAGVTVVRQIRGNIARAFQTSATPHGFVVNPRGEVAAARITNSVADLRRLLEDALTGDQRPEREVALGSGREMREHA